MAELIRPYAQSTHNPDGSSGSVAGADSTDSCSKFDLLEHRVTVLEEGIETSDEELYRLGHDFKFLLVEISLVLDWVKERFGVELINKESQIYKHIHHDLGYDEITAIKRSISVPFAAQAGATKSESHSAPAPVVSPGFEVDDNINLVTADSDGSGSEYEDDDDQGKDPDFNAIAECHKQTQSQTLGTSGGTSKKRRSGSASSESSSESIQLQHHQRQAWKNRSSQSRGRIRRVLPPQNLNVTPFVRKLWRMVDEPDTNHVIEWSADGDGFQIHDQFILAQDLLPVNFKHNNIASFVRQLNWYGFRKYPGLDAECRFVHKNFRRGRPDLLIKVRRRMSVPDGPRGRGRRMDPSPPSYSQEQDLRDQTQMRAEVDPFETLDLEEMEEVTPYDPGGEVGDN